LAKDNLFRLHGLDAERRAPEAVGAPRSSAPIARYARAVAFTDQPLIPGALVLRLASHQVCLYEELPEFRVSLQLDPIPLSRLGLRPVIDKERRPSDQGNDDQRGNQDRG
jgi:hypothetical protein